MVSMMAYKSNYKIQLIVNVNKKQKNHHKDVIVASCSSVHMEYQFKLKSFNTG